ncbi:hypothetical protein AAG906_020681 [Vitis piasezkii]
MTFTRAFEKLRDSGLIILLAPCPLPHPIPPHFHLHKHCLYHQIQGHDTKRCAALYHAIHDLIDLGLVNLSGLSVTTNPLPMHWSEMVRLEMGHHGTSRSEPFHMTQGFWTLMIITEHQWELSHHFREVDMTMLDGYQSLVLTM